MLSVCDRIEIRPAAASKIKLFWILGISLLLALFLSIYQVWKPITLIAPPPSAISPSTEVQREIYSWLINHPDLSQAQNRHRAFRDLTTILQQHDDAALEVEKSVLLNSKSSMELLAVTVGVLSSQGTSPVQQALSHSLLAFRNEAEKAMLVLPQIMLLEKPQDFLFDELQAFIRKSHHPILRENAELALAGLSQQAAQTNPVLAERIALWLEGKKAVLPKNPQALSAFLDLLGNTGNETFLADILQATTHEDAGVRARAAFALRFFKGDQVVKTLEKLAVDQNSQVRTKATEALSYFHRNHDHSDETLS
jgi:hypothetical protein